MLGHIWYLNLKLKYIWPHEKGMLRAAVSILSFVQHGLWGSWVTPHTYLHNSQRGSRHICKYRMTHGTCSRVLPLSCGMRVHLQASAIEKIKFKHSYLHVAASPAEKQKHTLKP